MCDHKYSTNHQQTLIFTFNTFKLTSTQKMSGTENSEEKMNCSCCFKDIVRESRDHDHCRLLVFINDEHSLVCSDCTVECKMCGNEMGSPEDDFFSTHDGMKCSDCVSKVEEPPRKRKKKAYAVKKNINGQDVWEIINANGNCIMCRELIFA